MTRPTTKQLRLMTVLASLAALGNLLTLFRLLPNWWRIAKLSAVTRSPQGQTDQLPRLSVIVPARNEAATIRPAVDSLLRQDYPALELVLIDDRSTDETGRIIAEVAQTNPDRVHPISIGRLPPGWLGKNHALWTGAQQASGDWLLFTDADIVFEPTCFHRAVTYAEISGADHLTLTPRVLAQGYWLRAFVAFFVYAFLTSERPYLAEDPKSKTGLGLGAFNLIRRAAYDTIGGHAAISLRPDDDMRLGMRVKRLGLRQRVLNGADLLHVTWYPSLGVAMRGLEKNLFAGLNYSLARALTGLAGGWLLTVAPYLLVWHTAGLARWLLGAAIGLHSANYVIANQQEGPAIVRYVPALPATGLVFLYVVARAIWLTIVHGGIQWRETFYPLEELRSQTGLEGVPHKSVGPLNR